MAANPERDDQLLLYRWQDDGGRGPLDIHDEPPTVIADSTTKQRFGLLGEESWIAQSISKQRALTPTQQAYQELQDAYTYFDRRLFGATLPNCLITMQRHARTYGFFCHNRFVSTNQRKQRTDEIALNPSYFAARTDTGVLSTLVHEMTHLWQFHNGKRPRRGYHSREWADRMIGLGLYPSNTGQPGGSETGYQMTHYIVEKGPFDLACRELLVNGFRLSWLENPELFGTRRPTTAKPQAGLTDSSNRWKYTCQECGLNAWAKPNALVACGACSPSPLVLMEPKGRKQ